MLHGSPWVYTYSHFCHQMITQRQPKGPRRSSRVTPNSQFFSQPILASNQPSPRRWGPIWGPIFQSRDRTGTPVVG